MASTPNPFIFFFINYVSTYIVMNDHVRHVEQAFKKGKVSADCCSCAKKQCRKNQRFVYKAEFSYVDIFISSVINLLQFVVFFFFRCACNYAFRAFTVLCNCDCEKKGTEAHPPPTPKDKKNGKEGRPR